MENSKTQKSNISVGIIGFGAFGRLIAKHIGKDVELLAHDAATDLENQASDLGVTLTTLENVALCDVIVLAVPVSSFEEILTSIAPICRSGSTVVDVGSVKMQPAFAMEQILPPHVNVVATHPLFGPESASDGIAGLKIAVCPVRGNRHRVLSNYFRNQLNLGVIETTPEEHDREAATVQGLTHLIAKVLLDMKPLPSRMTTRSFDLLMEAISMVQYDAPEVFHAIEQQNRFAPEVRRRFFNLANELRLTLEAGEEKSGTPSAQEELTLH